MTEATSLHLPGGQAHKRDGCCVLVRYIIRDQRQALLWHTDQLCMRACIATCVHCPRHCCTLPPVRPLLHVMRPKLQGWSIQAMLLVVGSCSCSCTPAVPAVVGSGLHVASH